MSILMVCMYRQSTLNTYIYADANMVMNDDSTKSQRACIGL